MAKRAEEVDQLSAMLASTSSLVSQDLSKIDEAQKLTGQELTASIDQLLSHCSQTKVCANGSKLLRMELLSLTVLTDDWNTN